MAGGTAGDLWPTTVAARRSLLSTFQDLDDEQWAVPSLCDGWTIRELLAHLILAAKPPMRRYAGAVVRARGSFDRANRALAVADGQRPAADLLASYRALVDHRFAPPGWPAAAPYSDILLHTLDARIPLGLPTDRPPADHLPVMDLLFGVAGRSFGSTSRPDVRWVATDLDWSRGDGPEVHGSMADLTLTAAGRAARLDALDGPGVDALRTWLG